MDEAILMQMFQRRRQGETQLYAFVERKPAPPGSFAAQRPGLVFVGIDRLTENFIVGDFHRVVKIAGRVIAPHMKDI